MSSATKPDPPAANDLAYAMGDSVTNGTPGTSTLGMSPRQLSLNKLWGYYRCQQYDLRKVDWDGHPNYEHIEHDAIASAGYLPPGFYDAGGVMLPLRFRKPSAPYQLVRLIVDRFTGLLFSEQHHPQIRVQHDPDTEDFLTACADIGRLWAQLMLARNFGGATGTACIGFMFDDGIPVFEVHDPRHTIPIFENRRTHKLASIEKRYMFQDYARGPKGEWIQTWFWYRRVIDGETDTTWESVPVGDGSEPEWERFKSTSIPHGIGECPVVWIQNIEVPDQIDGDPDCLGTYPMIEQIDMLNAQGIRGTLSNADPTFFAATDAELDSIAKGSDNAIKLEKGADAKYLEISGTGPKAAFEAADRLEDKVLHMTKCVIDQSRSVVQKTATEVDKDYSAMWEEASKRREQYGERGVKRLLAMLLRAARKLTSVKYDEETGLHVRGKIVLPPRAVKNENGTTEFVERKLGPSETLSLQWPAFTHPTTEEIAKRVESAGKAKQYGLIDDEHATKYVAQDFSIEDTAAMLKNAKAAQEEMTAAVDAQYRASRFGAR